MRCYLVQGRNFGVQVWAGHFFAETAQEAIDFAKVLLDRENARVMTYPWNRQTVDKWTAKPSKAANKALNTPTQEVNK